jgi:pyruvate,water dikinase
MDSGFNWAITLAEAADTDERFIGGKAAKLAQLTRAGFRVPRGFCVTTAAYERFLREQRLADVIRMELGRKPFESMRWEEIWDTALRIRSAFLATPVPAVLSQAIGAAVEELGVNKALAVRSSAPGEDSANRSFAGLHESLVGVVGVAAVLDAVRVVWASLWSDAALLYRQELSLDPARSRMAVVVQELVEEDRSGVAFGRDPRDAASDRAVVEAVPGPCGDLVDGLVDPDRWILKRSSGEVLEWRAGDREQEQDLGPILETSDLTTLLRALTRVESLFDWPPDIEWTGRVERFTLLQARPITTVTPRPDDKRDWYLTLRPGRGSRAIR